MATTRTAGCWQRNLSCSQGTGLVRLTPQAGRKDRPWTCWWSPRMNWTNFCRSSLTIGQFLFPHKLSREKTHLSLWFCILCILKAYHSEEPRHCKRPLTKSDIEYKTSVWVCAVHQLQTRKMDGWHEKHIPRCKQKQRNPSKLGN